jgi:endonuclease/exonuclease/phosphatase (EEP) superfamily protein YafD
VLILSRRPPASARLVWHSGHQVMTLTQATFRDGRGPYSVVAVHWPRPTRPAFQHQQLRWLALALAVEPRARTILVGDFNTTPWSPRWRAWERASGLIRRDRALFSWPAGHAFGVRRLPPVPLLPIDHVYAGAGWATVSVRRGPELGSDHYPLVMTLAPRQRWNAPIAVRTKRENNTTVTRAR